MITFDRITLPSGALALNVINIGWFNEIYPLEDVSVSYNSESKVFILKITCKRIIHFTRGEVLLPSSDNDEDLLNILNSYLIMFYGIISEIGQAVINSNSLSVDIMKEGTQLSLTIDKKQSNYIVVYNHIDTLADLVDRLTSVNHWFLIMNESAEIYKVHIDELENYNAFSLEENEYNSNLTELYNRYLLSKNYVKNRRRLFFTIVLFSLLFAPLLLWYLIFL